VTMTWQELDEVVGGLPRSAVDHFPAVVAWRPAQHQSLAARRLRAREGRARQTGRVPAGETSRPEHLCSRPGSLAQAARASLHLTFNPGPRTVITRAEIGQTCTKGSCPRGDLNPH